MLAQEKDLSLTEQLSSIVLDNNDMNSKEIQSLLDLPEEIIVAIIEEEGLTLEDRMNLRQTCKRMESLVAACEFNSVTTLIMQKVPTGPDNKYLTSISLLYEMADEATIPEGRHASFIRLISQLFRRAHFEDIHINNFDFRPEAPPNLMNADQLLQLVGHFTCDDLRIDISRPYYDPRIFDIIAKLNPTEDLWLIATTSLSIDQELLKNLPPVSTLRFKTSKSSFFMISDETILALVAKHRFVSLGERAITVQPETLLEAAKIIATNGHMFLITLHYALVVEMLHLTGVSCIGSRLVSSDPAVTIHRKVKLIKRFNTSMEDSDYTIDVCGTKLTIYGMISGVRQTEQELVVEIGDNEGRTEESKKLCVLV